ncbi:carbohydrate porin [Burkholderia sp. WSM2232]|uniref:carbohydrate porin n=1 Tax=Burkholderia sp. WSM2232 TaxID=944436 RepID=UPI000487D6B5|nr:carbohydrate porin [Burkholderia sp. WSM2232]
MNNIFTIKRLEPIAAGALLALFLARPALADTIAASAPEPSSQGLWNRTVLFGDMAGVRSWLDRYGVSLGLQETDEYLRNLSGGTRRGGAYDGTTQLDLSVDTQRAFGLPGGTLHASALQIHGTSLSQRNLDLLQNASGLEANAGTRLWELWYRQSLLEGSADLKLGQQSLDQEFMTSEHGATFMNATFGWPGLPSADMPDGGPAYPLSSLGARLRVSPSNAWTILAGVFDGNPAGPGEGDPQRRNAHGTTFNLHGGALLIAEAQFTVNQESAKHSAQQTRGMPGTYKLGLWYNTQHFGDLRIDSAGGSLANSTSNGAARQHAGNHGFYAIADQMVWRQNTYSARSLSVFAELMAAPGDRNLIDMGINAGVTLSAPFNGRDADVVGLALGYSRIGSHARSLDRDTQHYTTGYPERTGETILEATYQYQVAPWWQLQGDLQFAIRPSGGIPDPNHPASRIGNETIVGIKSTIEF